MQASEKLQWTVEELQYSHAWGTLAVQYRNGVSVACWGSCQVLESFMHGRAGQRQNFQNMSARRTVCRRAA